MGFALNAWYVAALSEEIADAFVSRRIVDQPVLLYRQDDGSCAALLDICSHRFAPLSMGVLKDGHVQCPYHGLEFDGAGRCVHNPHGDGRRSSNMDVRSFPLVERDGLVWIWPGARAAAALDLVPDYSCRTAPDRRTVGGYAHVDCSYRLLIDNLMDLSHAQYVHSANAQTDAFERVRREVVIEDGSVQNLMMFPASSPTVFVRKVLGHTNQPVDIWNDIRWRPVGAMLNFIAFAPAGAGKERSVNTMGTHIVTPETETTCHYFFGASRNFALDDPEIDAVYTAWQHQALTLEDKPMVQAVQRREGDAIRNGMRPSMLACDGAAVRVGWEIDQLVRREAA